MWALTPRLLQWMLGKESCWQLDRKRKWNYLKGSSRQVMQFGKCEKLMDLIYLNHFFKMFKQDNIFFNSTSLFWNLKCNSASCLVFQFKIRNWIQMQSQVWMPIMCSEGHCCIGTTDSQRRSGFFSPKGWLAVETSKTKMKENKCHYQNTLSLL